MKAKIQCVELAKLSVLGMCIKVRWFPQGADDQRVWHARSNILSLSRVFKEARSGVAPYGSSQVSRLGPLMFRPRAAVWNNRMHRDRVLTVSAYFDTNLSRAAAEEITQEMVVDDYSMLEMMQMLHDEMRAPGAASAALVSAIGDILRIKLARLMGQSTRRAAPSNACRNLDLAMIRESISAARGPVPTTAELARHCHTSRRSLLRLFKSTTGSAPSRYLEDMKIQNAKNLLVTSTLSMKQIAHASGYATASHFSARFHRLTGLTPSAFRGNARRRESNEEAWRPDRVPYKLEHRRRPLEFLPS